ncbi:Multidrug transporter [Cohnella lubricantis]|nr:hypothetical protein [Cohnella lubricantis]
MEQKSKVLQELKTEQTGITDQHRTRVTRKPVQIDPPDASPGPYTRSYLEDNN